MLTAPLESSLIRMDEELKQGALNVFVLVRVAFTCCWETSNTDNKNCPAAKTQHSFDRY